MSNLSYQRYEELKQYIGRVGKDGVVIAFSGGVDSSTLAKVSYEVLGEKAIAVTAMSPTYPLSELEDAKHVAAEIGIRHQITTTDELSNEDFAGNPENRCYYCKTELLDKLKETAQKMGFKVVFEGTNRSDLGGHRPGFTAVKERTFVLSPWVECGFTKDDIRQLARQLGLSVHDKPSLACLASRVAFDTRITKERLERIERAEEFIKSVSGVRQVRVRDHDGLARIEVGRDERCYLLDVDILDEVSKQLKQLGFTLVTIDIDGYRTGSMIAARGTTNHDLGGHEV